MRKVLVIAGPSAAGKTTVMKHLVSQYGKFELVRSATTREARGDGHDSEYVYLSADEFKSRIEKKQMLEYTEYGGNLYGTPLSEVDRIFREGKIPLLILDINGVLSLKKNTERFKTVAVYITADMQTLDARLEERARASGNTDSALAALEKRKLQNRRDVITVSQSRDKFDALIANDDIKVCAEHIYELFTHSI